VVNHTQKNFFRLATGPDSGDHVSDQLITFLAASFNLRSYHFRFGFAGTLIEKKRDSPIVQAMNYNSLQKFPFGCSCHFLGRDWIDSEGHSLLRKVLDISQIQLKKTNFIFMALVEQNKILPGIYAKGHICVFPSI